MPYFDKNSIPIKYNGRMYKNRTELYHHLKPDVSRITFLRRLRDGMSVDKAMLVKKGISVVTWKGKRMRLTSVYRTFKNPATTFDTFKSRVNSGMSITMAIKQSRRDFRKSGRKIKFRGVTKNMSDWDRKMHYPVGTIKKRIFRGWSIKDAITIPVELAILHRCGGKYGDSGYRHHKVRTDGRLQSLRALGISI